MIKLLMRSKHWYSETSYVDLSNYPNFRKCRVYLKFKVVIRIVAALSCEPSMIQYHSKEHLIVLRKTFVA